MSLRYLYVFLYIVCAIPVWGYVRYLHDDEENRLGAAAVFGLILLAGLGVYLFRL